MVKDYRKLGVKEVAQAADINRFYELTGKDPKLIDHIDEFPFKDTPLHVDVEAVLTHFAIEIMRLKPSFSKKLNPAGLATGPHRHGEIGL
ncbi:hypothetical protein LguiA_017992 [Lonicera macranthoides]